ncbi:MAG: sodium:solute symporter family protein [Candidatus Solibacter usitatus]|nr:sodium:solute symporter family protein [Candidatus Solibacter usitatus]
MTWKRKWKGRSAASLSMNPSIFVFLYLAVVLYIGIFAFRRPHPEGAEDFFLASRSLGPFVFLLSLFGTNMTAFTILGSSGHAFHNGIVTYGLMASSSALVIPLTLFIIGTRMWALGKKFGFMTPVQMFRHRWECGHIGTVIFAVQAALLVPYIIIGVMGGGTTLAAISGGAVPYWLGGAIVALTVMSYVFFGGMRGTAWVNTFQTILFLCFGAVALMLIGSGMGGFEKAMEALRTSPATAPLLTRERVSPLFFLSYTFIPLSSIAFPHIAIFCLTARKMTQFKKTVILYPLCILAIWLPCVFLGVTANRSTDVEKIRDKVEARSELAQHGLQLSTEERGQLRVRMQADDVVLLLLDRYAPLWLAGLLGAGIMAAVMASDSQILALSTMFTEDVFAFYGGKERFGETVQVNTGRLFVVLVTLAAYAIALGYPQNIFDLAVQYAFSGYAALSPLLFGALFWRRSTKWGALAVALWVTVSVIGTAVFQTMVPAPTGPPLVVWNAGGLDILMRTANGTAILGLMPVVPMTIISAMLLVMVSLATRAPSRQTISRYFREVPELSSR